MRKVIVSLVLFAALAALACPASAQVPGPGGPYGSAFTVQNLDAEDAACTFSLYGASDTFEYTSGPFAITGKGSYFVYIGNLALGDGQFSAVVACDKQVAGVVNLTGPDRAGSYTAFRTAETAPVLYPPGVYKNYSVKGFTSNLIVHNTADEPVDIDVEIYQAGSGTPIETFTENDVPSHTAVSFDQGDLATDGIYSSRIVATGDVAAVVNIWNPAGQLYSYNSFNSWATVAYAPVLMNNYYGFSTALTVQNMGTSSTEVTVTYSNDVTHSETISPSTAYLFYTPNEGMPDGWLGSAKVESDGEPVVALINEEGLLNRAASYLAFTQGSTGIEAPIVMNDYYDYSTSITCQNVGAAATDITVTYSDPSATTSTANDVPVNGTVLFYQPNVPGLPVSFNGSAIITADEDIVCIINENQVDNPAEQDWLLAYNGTDGW